MGMLINNSIFDKMSIPFYEKVLDVSSKSQKATASNIANVNTPGYEAKEVNFVDEMKRSLAGQNGSQMVTTDSRHLPTSTPERIAKIRNASTDDDASGTNNVDVEKEMGDLAENQMLYEFGTKKLAKTFSTLRMAIRGKAQ
jgi:flagellar basal-body rod protein FlgB